MIEIEYNYALMRMCKPRSLYAVHVADCKVWSGYFGQFMYMYTVHSTEASATLVLLFVMVSYVIQLIYFHCKFSSYN